MKTMMRTDYWAEIPAGEYLTGLSDEQRTLILNRFMAPYRPNTFSAKERQLLASIIAKKEKRAKLVNRDRLAASTHPIRFTTEERALFEDDIFLAIISFADSLTMLPSQRAVWVDRFYMARFPVTDEQFIALEKGLASANNPVALDWSIEQLLENPHGPAIRQMLRHNHGGHITLPGRRVSSTTREDALRFCQRLGVRLPTRPEWEKAARGTDGRLYPWGNEWRPNAGYFYRGQPISGQNRVDAFPEGNSPYGLWVMMGNLPEMIMAHSFWPSVASEGSHPKESSQATAWLDYMLPYYDKSAWLSFRPALSHWPRQQWSGVQVQGNPAIPSSRHISLPDELPTVLTETNQAVITADNVGQLQPCLELVPGPPYRVEVTHHIRQFVWSPDGAWLAIATGEDLRLCQLRTGTTHQLADCWEAVAYSPDGLTVAAPGLDRQSLRLFDSQTGRETNIFNIPRWSVRNLIFSPDAMLLAETNNKGEIVFRDPINGAEVVTWVGHTDKLKSVVFDPTGSWLASAGMDGTVRLWAMSSSTLVAVLTQQTCPIYDLAFSPDGQLLAAATAKGHILIWEGQDQTERFILTEANDNLVASISFSPDGRLLAAGYANGMFKVWQSATGNLLTTVNVDMGWVIQVGFSPDGQFLATGSQMVVLWSVPHDK